MALEETTRRAYCEIWGFRLTLGLASERTVEEVANDFSTWIC
jgi:hypothetical protein